MTHAPTTPAEKNPGEINLERYKAEGFLELGRRLGSSDVNKITELFDELDAESELPDTWEAQYDESSGSRRLRKLRRLTWNEPELFSSILCRAGVPDIAETVIGPDAVMVFHAAFLKPAVIGTAVGLHQDQALWSRDYPGAFSVWIALTDVNQGNGGLAGRPASHLEQIPHSDDPEHPWHPTLAAVEDTLGPPHNFILEPGDAVIWDRLFAHSSGANVSQVDRRGMVVVFADGGDGSFDPVDAISLDEIRKHAGATG